MQRAGYLLPATLTGYLWIKGLHPLLPGWPCPLRALTGIPCPTCFLTRATTEALHGDLNSSVQWHAFGPVVAAMLIVWSVLAIQQRQLMPFAIHAWHLIVAAVALISYWLVRLGLNFGLGMQAFPVY